MLSFVPDDICATAGSSGTTTATFVAIVEAADATPEQLEIREANSSIYVFRADALWPALEGLSPPTRRASCT